MIDIVWEDPPPPAVTGPKSMSKEFVAALEANPGRWARWGTEFTTSAGVVRLRREYPHIEWVTRKVDGKVHAYARFTGGAA